jgi:hypothetical protein
MLSNIDLLGGKVNYKVFGRSTFRIPFGGFLTLLLLCTFCYFIMDIFIPFLKRETPRVTVENLKTLDPPIYHLKANNFFMAYRLILPGYNVDELFNITATYHEISQGKNFTTHNKKSIPLRKVTIGDFQDQEYVYENLNLEDSKTWVLDFDQDMSLKGSAVAKYFNYVAIQVDLLSLEDEYLFKIFDILQENTATLQVFFSDISIKLTNYTKPYSNFISYFQDDVSMTNHKTTSLEYSTQNMTIDSGYAFKAQYSTTIQTMFQISSIKVSNRAGMQKNIYTAQVILNKLRNNYLVTYMKIPELVSIMGGIFTVLYLFFGALNNYVNKYILNTKIIESVFTLDRDFEEELKNNFNKKGNPNSSLELSKEQPNSNVKSPGSERKFHEENIDEIEDKSQEQKNDNSSLDKSNRSNNVFTQNKKTKTVVIKKTKKRKVYKDEFFSCEDMMFTLFLFCCRTSRVKKRHELFQKAKRYMNIYMDVINLTKKVIEVDLIKYLILNPTQLPILDIIGKPYLTLNEKNLDKNKFSHSYLDYARLGMRSDYEMKHMNTYDKDKIVLAFNTLKNKEQLSIIDRKIISSCEENLELLR